MADDDIRLLAVQSEYAQRRLEAAKAGRNRLEKRGDAIVTTTGGLVTAIGAVGVFLPKQEGFQFPVGATICFIVALVLFLSAVVLTQLTYLFDFRQDASPFLRASRTALGKVPREDAMRAFLEADMATVDGLEEINSFLFRWLGKAAVCQMFAVVALTIGVGVLVLLS